MLKTIPDKNERGIKRCLAIVNSSHNVCSFVIPIIILDNRSNSKKAEINFKTFLYSSWIIIKITEITNAIVKVISFLYTKMTILPINARNILTLISGINFLFFFNIFTFLQFRLKRNIYSILYIRFEFPLKRFKRSCARDGVMTSKIGRASCRERV